jgi:hypothetical protein|nr:MAG TPA: hypothetical protein [Caudoviricetes sp.]
MIILLIIISIIGFVISCVIEDDIAGFFLACSGVLFVIAIVLGVLVSNGRTIDEKISMYQEENTKIEKQIDTLVSNYMNYESNTYEKFKSESSITLVSMYPELKSDKLVEEQISVYEENNKKIRELKEDKINLKVKKWWLYFGGRMKSNFHNGE